MICEQCGKDKIEYHFNLQHGQYKDKVCRSCRWNNRSTKTATKEERDKKHMEVMSSQVRHITRETHPEEIKEFEKIYEPPKLAPPTKYIPAK